MINLYNEIIIYVDRASLKANAIYTSIMFVHRAATIKIFQDTYK
jgi:hypothetical protein